MIPAASEYLSPDWAVSEVVRALSSTRIGGSGVAPYEGFNLGLHVGDDPKTVHQNRAQLQRELDLPGKPFWLEQVHGADVVYVDSSAGVLPKADAAWTDRPGCVLSVMTADCLPVLFASQCGSVVAVAHAGWRGLLAGVLQNTISRLPVKAGDLYAWLGPAIGPNYFEVGGEVREAFLRIDTGCDSCFVVSDPVNGKYFADIFALGRRNLEAGGVKYVSGGDYCTYSDESFFFSHRRDKGVTGRMASIIWKS